MSDVPSDLARVQIESVTFNYPISDIGERLTVSAALNYMREIIYPVGTIMASMIASDADYADLTTSDRWVLADGRDVTGSRYQTITGSSTVPDLRGIYIRGKNNGRSNATGNSSGDLALGTYQVDNFTPHNHAFTGIVPHLYLNSFQYGYYVPPLTSAFKDDLPNPFPSTVYEVIVGNNTTINETRSRNVTINYFIRIN